MDEFNYLQFLDDPNELLQAQDLHLVEFPTLSLYFDEFFLAIFLQHLLKIRVIPSPAKQKQTKPHNSISRANTRSRCSRFPVVSSDAKQELKSIAVNKNKLRPAQQNNG